MKNEKTLKLIAVGLRLASAGLSTYIAFRKMRVEVTTSGNWKTATPDEAGQVEEAIADMVATYASQEN